MRFRKPLNESLNVKELAEFKKHLALVQTFPDSFESPENKEDAKKAQEFITQFVDPAYKAVSKYRKAQEAVVQETRRLVQSLPPLSEYKRGYYTRDAEEMLDSPLYELMDLLPDNDDNYQLKQDLRRKMRS